MSRALPPLNALRAFEAAARHLSFSRAAEGLGVTQGAISKHIIALEDFVGAQVFVRAPTGLSLTQEGYTLTEALRPAFAMMTDAFAHCHRRPPRSNICRIATLASFAGQFLAPHLSAFLAAHPDIEIDVYHLHTPRRSHARGGRPWRPLRPRRIRRPRRHTPRQGGARARLCALRLR